MIIGYARVSTETQSLDLQTDALKKYGCENIYTDTISGAKKQRPGLDEAFKYLREGDMLVVWKLDRLGRSLKNLIEVMNYLKDNKINFCSLQENIDTTTSVGKLNFHFFGALAEFERDLIRDRVIAGMTAARARGRLGGRRVALNKKQTDRMIEIYNDKRTSISEIKKIFGISKTTLYKYLDKNKDKVK